MGIKNKIGIAVKRPSAVIEKLLRMPVPGCLFSDRSAVRIYYRLRFKKAIDLKNPRSFNEKLLWLTLHDRRRVYTRMADKYEAKNYMREIFLARGLKSDCIVPTVGIYDSFDEINFEKLPTEFVMKTTHDSGGTNM